MKPIKFHGSNIVFGEGQPQYQQLPAQKLPDGQVITCWELSEEEVQSVIENKKIYIQVYTFNQPLQPLLPLVNLEDGITFM